MGGFVAGRMSTDALVYNTEQNRLQNALVLSMFELSCTSETFLLLNGKVVGLV